MLGVLSSMKLGLFLLLLLGFISAVGTFIYDSQGEFYRSPFFKLLLALLALNLLVCTLRRLRPVMEAVFRQQPPAPSMESGDNPYCLLELGDRTQPQAVAEVQALLRRKGFKTAAAQQEEVTALNASRTNIGPLGSLLTHTGMLLILLGALIFSALGSTGRVYLPVGAVFSMNEQIKGGGQYQVQVKGFVAENNPDGTPSQYTTTLTASNGREESSYKTEVNSPARIGDVKIYQSSWGSGVKIMLSSGSQDTSATVMEGEVINIPGTGYFLKVYQYLADYDPAGDTQGSSRELGQGGPRVAYSIYEGNSRAGVGLGELNRPLKLDDGISITFLEPVFYTGLQLKRDPGQPVLWAGCALLLAGILISFYHRPGELWRLRIVSRPEGPLVLEIYCRPSGRRHRYEEKIAKEIQELFSVPGIKTPA
jgi:cytochrome c biogenesis protein